MSRTARASSSSTARRHPTEVEKLITDALGKDSGVLSLTDEKGRRFLVQAAKIAYVEIGAADSASGRLRCRRGPVTRPSRPGKRHV